MQEIKPWMCISEVMCDDVKWHRGEILNHPSLPQYKWISAGSVQTDHYKMVSHKKHLMTGKSKALSQDLCNPVAAKHTDGTGYQRVCKCPNNPVSTVGAIIRKREGNNFSIEKPRSSAFRKISSRGVEGIIRKVDLELTGTIFSKKTISNTLNCHDLYACSPRKTP